MRTAPSRPAFQFPALVTTGWTLLRNALVVLGGVVAVACAGQVVVPNISGGTVQVFDYSGGLLNTFSGFGTPLNVVASANGHFYVVDQTAGTIGEYTASGVVNANLITGLTLPSVLAVSSSGDLYVGNNAGNVSVFSSAGSLLNASLFTQPGTPRGMVFDSAGNIYVTSYGGGVVGKYDGTTGATINASLISLAGGAYGLAIDGSDNLYVVGPNSPQINVGKYSNTGAVINAALTGTLPYTPFFTAVDTSGNVYVSNNGAGTIEEYDATGTLVNSTFITGLNNPGGFTFLVVPEPETWVLLAGGCSLLALTRWRRRRA